MGHSGKAGRGPDGATLAMFALAVTLGGSNFIAVRFSNRDLAPFWGAGLRFSVAAALFVVICLALRLRWPRGRELALTVTYGALAFALNYALLYWALVRVTAGLATIVLAVVPLVTLLLAAAQRTEQLTARSAAGAVLALAGIAWMTLGPAAAVIPLTALLAMVASALTVGQGIILSKRLSGNHPAMTNAVGMSTGAVLLLILSRVSGEPWVLPTGGSALVAVAYLVTLGSVGLFVLVLLVVRRWTASASSYMFVLIPLVTLALGALLAGEPVTPDAIVGAVLVMMGVWFGALAPAARRAAGVSPPLPLPVAGGADAEPPGPESARRAPA